MKYIRILLLVFITILISGCTSKNVTIADKLSEKILEAHHTENVSTKGLSKQELTLFNNFLLSQKIENKILNISEYITLSEQSYSEYDTPNIYKENDNYYVKYTDINWLPIYNDYEFVVNLNGMSDTILKSQVPILYEETNTDRFNYHLIKKAYDKDTNTINYYYKSIADKTGLVIKFHLTKRKITSISTVYQDVFYYPEDGGIASNALTVIKVIGIFILIGLIAFGFVKLMQRFNGNVY